MPVKRIDSILTISGLPPTVDVIPPNWPQFPSPDKIKLLWNSNNSRIYHRFSPYTNYENTLLSPIFSDQQPFVYTYIDKADKGLISGLPNFAKSLLSTVNITQDSVNDIVRVSKFQISSWGVQFLAKQALIQRQQPFDETRVYNPLSPILSTIRPMTIGLGERPMRHIEGGILGFANSITSTIGINFIGRGFITPKSTAGDKALSDYNIGQGKGLIRGGTATSGWDSVIKQWSGPDVNSGGLGFQGLLSKVKVAVNKMFGTSAQPPGTQVRADENTYSRMAMSSRLFPMQPWYPTPETKINSPKKSQSLLSSINSISSTVMNVISNPTTLIGMGINSSLNMAGSDNVTFYGKKIIAMPNNQFLYVETKKGFRGNFVNGKPTGYDINGNKYGNNVNINYNDIDSLENSDMIVQFSLYQNEQYRYNSKFTEPTSPSVKGISNNLKAVIDSINGFQTLNNLNFNNTTYTAKTSTYSKLLSSGDPKSIGYDNLFSSIPFTPTSVNTYGVMKEYNNGDGKFPSAIDKRVNSNKNLKFATTFTSDGLNQLGILKRNKFGAIEIPYESGLASQYKNWIEYKPYDDDLIAFFFYDIVNKKYIPFRATIKGISEGNTAFWDELRFIGRADQLYSYNGFSRTLSFGFNIVINSVTELLPSWKKINYIASATKPSNYTRTENQNGVYNKFIVPPMFMITVGDLYTYQPIIIRSVNVNIPDDALWETLNQYNSTEWSYLNGIIKNSHVQGDNSSTAKYGQLPREVEIQIEGALLEKERAQVGGSHYGHAPRKDNWDDFLDPNGELNDSAFLVGVGGTELEHYMPKPSYLHKQMIEANSAAKSK